MRTLTAWHITGYFTRFIPPAKTAKVRAVWKQKLRSMCQPFLLIRIVLFKVNKQTKKPKVTYLFTNKITEL